MAIPYDAAPYTLWSLDGEEKVASCQVRFVPIGTEVRILRNATLLMSRIFVAGDEALAWAEEQGQEHLAAGWRQPK